MNLFKTFFTVLVVLLLIPVANETRAQSGSNSRPRTYSPPATYTPPSYGGSASKGGSASRGSSSFSGGAATRGGSSARGSSTRDGSSSKDGSLNRNEEELPPLSPEAQAAMDQFELTRTTLTANKRNIDMLYRTIPIGFVEKQLAHMQKIKALEKQTDVLEIKIIDDAVALFRLAPTRNRFATGLVLNQVGEALNPKGPDSHFNPKMALEICSLLLNEENLPWKVLIQAFRASYALQDFERGRLILDRLEEIGTLKPVYYERLENTAQKWEDELLIRRQEGQTGDLPIAVFETTAGTFKVELFENQAPLTVNNFVALAEEGYYDGRAFFQVKPGEYAATGCTNDNGTSSLGYAVAGEATHEKARSHFAGTLTMTPDQKGNTGAKFIICHQPKTELDGQFTAFGRIMSEDGLNVAYQLNTHDATSFSTVRTRPSTVISVTIANKRSHQYVKTPVDATVTSTAEDGDTDTGLDQGPSSFDLLQKNN